MIFTPISFDSIDLANFTDGFSTQTFEMPFPDPLSMVERMAGGGVFDFNYDEDDLLVPRPFNIVVVCEGSTAAILLANYRKLFASPFHSGRIGRKGMFVCQVHGSAVQYSAPCRMGRPLDTINSNIYEYDEVLRANIRAPFLPLDLFHTLVP